MTTTPAEAVPAAPTVSDRLRTIAARLCLSDETKLDGRMLLASAEEVARIESDLVTISEQAEEIIASLNDPLNGLGALSGTLEALRRKHAKAVDGSDKPSDQP